MLNIILFLSTILQSTKKPLLSSGVKSDTIESFSAILAKHGFKFVSTLSFIIPGMIDIVKSNTRFPSGVSL